MFLYLSMRSILTSRIIVFLAISSSSDSLNFLIATDGCYYRCLTEFSSFLAFCFVDDSVGTLSNDANYLIFVHTDYNLNTVG